MNPLFNIKVHQSSGGQKYIVKGSIYKDFSKFEWFRYYSKEIQENRVNSMYFNFWLWWYSYMEWLICIVRKVVVCSFLKKSKNFIAGVPQKMLWHGKWNMFEVSFSCNMNKHNLISSSEQKFRWWLWSKTWFTPLVLKKFSPLFTLKNIACTCTYYFCDGTWLVRKSDFLHPKLIVYPSVVGLETQVSLSRPVFAGLGFGLRLRGLESRGQRPVETWIFFFTSISNVNEFLDSSKLSLF